MVHVYIMYTVFEKSLLLMKERKKDTVISLCKTLHTQKKEEKNWALARLVNESHFIFVHIL